MKRICEKEGQCEVCGKSFVDKTHRQMRKYCGPTCGMKAWRKANPQHKEQDQQYWRANKDKLQESRTKRHRERYQTEIAYRIKDCLRTRLRQILKHQYKAGSAIADLGCSAEQLKVHLESQFLPGMSWDNWSKHGWHIDHIIPLASFDLTDEVQLKKACHYTNLQPLWAQDNISKGDKIL